MSEVKEYPKAELRRIVCERGAVCSACFGWVRIGDECWRGSAHGMAAFYHDFCRPDAQVVVKTLVIEDSLTVKSDM